jgi:octanoyl-[GcvH]:protein N-octanoyltransferase
MADPLGRCWRLWDDDLVDTASEGLARDSEMAARLAADEALPTARLWTAERAIVATARERRLPGFMHAADRLQTEGWPVVVRMTGGSAFPTGPDVLNLSLVFRCTGTDTIDSVYRVLRAPIGDALAELGLETEWGRGHGAFCEGDSDLLFKGAKLVGTAQCWKAGGAILAHAGILVAGDVRAASNAVNRFHLWSGGTARVRPDAVTSVANALALSGRDADRRLMRRVRSCLRQSLSRRFYIRMEPHFSALGNCSALGPP